MLLASIACLNGFVTNRQQLVPALEHHCRKHQNIVSPVGNRFSYTVIIAMVRKASSKYNMPYILNI
jgi:hypothetical protein